MPAHRRYLPARRPHAQEPHPHQVRLLSGHFRYAGRLTLFGVARLFGDRIELTNWGITGPRRRRIHLEDITEMDYHPLSEGSNLSIGLGTGEQVHLRLDNAHVWRDYYENWLRYDVLPSAKLIADPEEALTRSG